MNFLRELRVLSGSRFCAENSSDVRGITSPRTISVILIGCADDLVVSDTGWEHTACSVRGHRHLCAFAPSPAESARLARRNFDGSENSTSAGQHRTLIGCIHGDAIMSKSAIQILATPQERALEASRQVALVVGASLVVALCARITIPLMPLTPVPLTGAAGRSPAAR